MLSKNTDKMANSVEQSALAGSTVCPDLSVQIFSLTLNVIVGICISAKKPRATKGHKLAEQFPAGEVLCDLCKKKWKLGNVIGQGGFGLIYLGKLQSIILVSSSLNVHFGI